MVICALFNLTHLSKEFDIAWCNTYLLIWLKILVSCHEKVSHWPKISGHRWKTTYFLLQKLLTIRKNESIFVPPFLLSFTRALFEWAREYLSRVINDSQKITMVPHKKGVQSYRFFRGSVTNQSYKKSTSWHSTLPEF